MKKLLVMIGLLALGAAAFALSLDLSIDANGWQGQYRGSQTAPLLEPGVPALNYLPVRVLIPFGERIESVGVILSEPQLQRNGVALDYVRAQQPISLPAADTTVPEPTIWNADTLFPAKDFDYLGSQFMRGHQIAVINVYPWKYNPVRGEVFSASSLRIEVQTVWDEDLASNSANFFTRARDNSDIRDLVLNPDALHSYVSAPAYRSHAPQSRLIDLSVPKKMIIITDSASEPLFQNYIQWRAAQNVSTALYLVSDIYASYTGADNAEKVRNFISDAYQTWASSSEPLEYVILGGDDEIVPERGCRGQVGQTQDNRMPTDIYFSNLDGDWNANGNDIWGEIADQVDMLPEVHIGRFPAETAAEFNNILRKTQYYVNYNTFSNNISVMFGENLNWNPVTWGGDYKDDVAQHIPESYFLRTMYQRDGTYSETGVWHAINEGAHVMNHMGHANEVFLLGQSNGTIEQLQNTEYGFLYSQGCYPAAFDQRTSGDGECIGEHLSTTSGGLFAFIGNTRYGWYAPGSINGASQFYDREYFIGLYETLNTRLGQALTYSRLQNLNAALSSDVMRWCYYEMVLFGDPSIEVKYPDLSLPLLSLEDYTVSDVEGDNDGTVNPGEIIRLHPVISNHQDWATAYNVTAELTGLPDGVVNLGGAITISQLQPGQTSDPALHFRLQLPQDVTYGTFTVTMELESIHPTTQLSTGKRNYSMTYEITLIDGRFPWDCQVGSKSAPLVYDLDNDGSLDIVYLDVYGEAYYIDNQGEEFGGFYTPPNQDIMRSPALGDITGDGEPEIVYASRFGRVYAASLDGTEVFDYQGGSPFLFTPVIAKLDNSGTEKVLAHSLNGNLHAINPDGTVVNGFPVDLGCPFSSELAAADLNGDGLLEIIAGCQNGNLHVLSPSGTPLPGFPVQVGGVITGSPTVLNNGSIAVGTNSSLVLVSSSGEILFSKPIQASMASGAVLGDLDLDGELEIVFVTLGGRLYAVNQQGSDLPGFPLEVGSIFNSPPLLANLDADPNPEILLSSYVNSVFAYKHDGSPLAGFPFVTSFNGSTPGTLCDFDDDGMLKLINGYSTGVLMLNLRRPETPVMPWITYRGSLKRHGSFASTGYLSNTDPVTPVFANSLSQNYPNPFNPSTTISFQIAEDGETRLAVYNLKGQLVRVLKDEYSSQGRHSVVWDGRDESGHPVASGLYLYRLQTRDASLTKRMLLAK
ncbi:MAG: VCBS repeat-containing protein [Candidatus Syntrophosphaera sp.]|nr:VCBS repeat-containing protein [Candidatus Syntrophosphaera sp.]